MDVLCVGVCISYHVFVCAVNIWLATENREVSIENNVCKGVDQGLIVDD